MRYIMYLWYGARLRVGLNRDELRAVALLASLGAVIVTVIAVLATLRVP